MMQLVYCIQWMEDSTLRLELHFSLRDVPISKLANIPITNTLSKTTHTVIDTDIIQFIINYIISEGFAVSHPHYH